MNLLKDGLEKGFVIKTDMVIKMEIDGITDTYPVYKVRIDRLYYNDQNDRIATWISQYKTEHGISKIDKNNIANYNDVIHDFITQSNPEKLKMTQKNIDMIGQQKYGVILNDGRIIDGNRRFTCLRNLAKDNPQFNYFETVILERDIENSAKQIKMLELKIQIGEESRVDYNPIDRLVGVYNDIVENNLLSIHEYAISTNAQSDSEVEKQVEIAKLLAEFLETINAPKQFYIARDMDLNGPLVELYAILKKIKDENKKEEVKYAVFTNFLMQPSGDMTRFVRNLKSVASSKFIDEFIEKEMEIAETILDKLPEPGKVNADTIKQLRSDEKSKSELRRTMEKVTDKVKVTQTRNKPIQSLNKIADLLENVDSNIFRKLHEEQLAEIKSQLDNIEELVNGLRGELNV